MNIRMLVSALPLLLAASGSCAADYPEIKGGLWSSNGVSADTRVPPQTGQMCTNNDVIKAMAEAQQKNPNTPCKALSHTHTGNTWTTETECNFGGQVKKSTAVTTTNGNTGLHTEIHDANGAVMLTTDMKYVGDCPAGMEPGDYVGSNGMRFNALKIPAPQAPPK